MSEQPPVLIRAMVNTLFDHNVNPFDDVASALTLIRAGFLVKDIETYWAQIQTMACMRQRNNDRR